MEAWTNYVQEFLKVTDLEEGRRYPVLIVGTDQGQFESKFTGKVECAPGAGQNQAAGLTVCRVW